MTHPKTAIRQPALPRNFEEPPRVVEGMVQDITGANRGRYRQTKSNPLRNYADSGQITEEQFLAGEWYEKQFKAMYPQGRDSTDLDRVTGGGAGLLIAECQADAMRRVIAVDSRLSASDRAIVRMVCGEGNDATGAVRSATKEMSKNYPVPRFKEALESLITAIAKSAKDKWSVKI